jgi:hypothetical protein
VDRDSQLLADPRLWVATNLTIHPTTSICRVDRFVRRGTDTNRHQAVALPTAHFPPLTFPNGLHLLPNLSFV